MSLNYKLDKISNWQELWIPASEEPGVKRLNGLTQTLIWLTIPIMCGEITEKNYKNVYQRIYCYERAKGAMRSTETQGDIYVTLEEVKRHIGLHTNVSTESDAAFRKNLANSLWRDAGEAVLNAEDESHD